MRPDIVVTESSGRPVLLVEVKARRGVDREWAAKLRRNLQAHGTTPAAPYFMILTNEAAFLWLADGPDELEVTLPDAEARTKDLLGRDLSEVDGRGLEFHVTSWLASLARGDSGVQSEAARDFLVGTGLVAAMQGAHVDLQVA